MQTMQIVWLAALVFFIVLEAATVALVSVWFCIGSLASLLVSLFFPQETLIQFIVFAAAGALSFVLLRPLARRWIDLKATPTNADANIGKLCQVVQEIRPAQFGRVKLEGLEWMARSNFVLPVGAWCRVLAIEGAKVVVAPVAPETIGQPE